MKIPEKMNQFLFYVKENIILDDSELEDDDYALTRKEKALLKRQEKLEAKREKGQQTKEQKVEELEGLEESDMEDLKEVEEIENLEEPDMEDLEEIEETENLEDNSAKVKKGIRFTEKLEELKVQLEKFQKEISIEERNEKRISLLEKLEELKVQLENEELTPLKRLILQVKLSSVETKLEKQMAYLSIEEFKIKMQEYKDYRTQKCDEKLEHINQDMEAIFDKEYELEKDIAILTHNMKERETSYQSINNATQKAKGTYEYHINPNVFTQLLEKQKQLEEVMQQKEGKEEEIKQLQEELVARHTEIDQRKENILAKYNPAAIQWNTIKTFFERVKKDIKEWWSTRRLEKDSRKAAIARAKKESKEETRRKIAEIKRNENQAMVENFREELSSHIPLKEQQEYTEKIMQQEEKVGDTESPEKEDTENILEENSEKQKKQEMLDYFKKAEQAKKEFKERMAKSRENQNGAYVEVENEVRSEEKTQQTEQAVEEERE